MQAKKDPDEVVLDPRKVRHVKATYFSWTYSNIASIALIPYDVRFVFGKCDLVDPKNANVVDKVSVTVSPEHAKRIHRFFWKKLKNGGSNLWIPTRKTSECRTDRGLPPGKFQSRMDDGSGLS